MINLRYHIVSLTAVFLAIGIGLAFGSSFLDQATVDNLRGQLDGLRHRIESRDDRISELEARLGVLHEERDTLDDQGAALLAGLAAGVPVVVVTQEGVDDDEVRRLVDVLVNADVAVAGTWWLTNRFELDSDAAANSLAEAVGVESTPPSTLRREATLLLAAAIRDRQALAPLPGDNDAGIDGTGDGADGEAATADNPLALDTAGTGDSIQAMFDLGFIDFEAIPDGPVEPHLPAGARILAVGGSELGVDDRMLLPLVDNLRSGPLGPSLVVVTSLAEDDQQDDDTAARDLVTLVRTDDDLREHIATVDRVRRFSGHAALLLALVDLGSGVIGHYGTEDGADRLLPAPADS